ncbi:type II secretion system protein GspL, partial [Thermodesulfobacteriota bacterium]
QVLPYELEPLLPYAVEDLIFDFQPTDGVSEADHSSLLAVAVGKKRMQSFLESLAPLGLTPEIVTVASYPIALFLNGPIDGLLLDIDESHCTLVAYGADHIHLVRSTPIPDAETPTAETLARWVRQTLAGFEKTLATDFNPLGVFITGSGLNGDQMEQDLAQNLSLPIHRVDLIRAADNVIKNEPAQPWEPHLMDSALALALAEAAGTELINFRRGPFSITKQWVENKKSLITSAALIALILIMSLAGIIIDTVALQKRQTALEQEIQTIFRSSFPDVKNIVDPLHQMRIGIEEAQQTDLIPGESGSTIRKLDILNDISRLIPDKIDVEIVSIVISEDNFVLSGNTDTFNAVDDMKSRMEKSKLVQSVTISSANLNRAGNRVRFKLKAQL